jgi:signal peptidase I
MGSNEISAKKEIGYLELKGRTFAERLRMAPAKQWVKLALCLVLILFFAAWSNAWWLLAFIPLALDVFITKYVHWSAWKESKHPWLQKVAEWVDAIVFALVVVYVFHTYLFQNYKIPTPSLEKTLLVGDFLVVSKLSYGPREPMTPLSFPLAQHTLPFFNCKSYIENPQWEYSRLKGLGEVERNDIVVFNYPAGDTVALLSPNQDYYSMVNIYGRDAVWDNPDKFGEIQYRPVDRRENYVKRCVALPGDEFQMKDGVVYVNGIQADDIETLQFNYFVETTRSLDAKLLSKLNVRKADRMLINMEMNGLEFLVNAGYADSTGSVKNFVYRLPLTKSAVETLKKNKSVVSVRLEPVEWGGKTFPYERKDGWTRDNYGPLTIPKQGATVSLDLNNLPLYERIIRNYELNDLEVKDGEIYINGKKSDSYTFKMDYYWMMGDNRHNSADSRYWGFVPMDHIVGKPLFIFLSWDEDARKVRWDRIFTKVHPD